MKRYAVILLFIFLSPRLTAQGIEKIVTLDSVVIAAVKAGFSVADFIDMVKNDTSFYEAFINLKRFPYRIESETEILDRNGKTSGWRTKSAVQHIQNGYRQLTFLSDSSSGRFYNRKKGNTDYLTIDMLDKVFFPEGILKVPPPAVFPVIRHEPGSKFEKQKEQIKTLIFHPGTEVKGLPLIGSKTSIFSERMTAFYDYSISTGIYQDSISCYIFSCKAKRDEKGHVSSQVVVRNLESWFDRKTFSIIARSYSLVYKSPLINLDVQMQVETASTAAGRIPVRIFYAGIWDVPFRKAERINFNVRVFPEVPVSSGNNE